jgi:hypothetical protein
MKAISRIFDRLGASGRASAAFLTKNFKGGTTPRIYPWNQSQIENPQAPHLSVGQSKI